MNRKLKTLGLALVAALALTAVMASAASAQFTSSSHHTILSGSQATSHVTTFGSGFGRISCAVSRLNGTSFSTADHIQTLSPTYENCKDSLGRTVDVTRNTLTYTFQSGVTAGETKGNFSMDGELVQTITTGGTHCRITITEEGNSANNGISYKNLGGSSGVEVTTNTNNVHSSVTGGFFACGTSATTLTSGTRTGTTVISGKDTAGNAVQLSID
jgi:hypothetical protein